MARLFAKEQYLPQFVCGTGKDIQIWYKTAYHWATIIKTNGRVRCAVRKCMSCSTAISLKIYQILENKPYFCLNSCQIKVNYF